MAQDIHKDMKQHIARDMDCYLGYSGPSICTSSVFPVGTGNKS